jgi:ABC-2 type transport system ATP-binding protein
MNAVEAAGLSKRYRHTWRSRLAWRARPAWALRDCTLAIPAGRVVALVGPNGAGKTTLLNLVVGLISPTEGSVTVLDGRPAGSARARDGVAFVAQDAPLYPNLSVADTLHLARNLNLRWDQARAVSRLADLGIPLGRKVGKLSGGQQAQLALTLAVARLPELIILDEPLARLDPLARHDFMASLMAAVAEEGLSVLFSSHVVAELERVADYLIVLSHGRLQVAGEVDGLIAGHRVLTGPASETDFYSARLAPVYVRRAGTQAHLLVRMDERATAPAGWQSSPVDLEELVLAYLREPAATALPGPVTLNRVAS